MFASSRQAPRPRLSLWRLLVALLTVAVVGAPLALAVQPAGASPANVIGRVLDDHGLPVAGAAVHANSQFGGPGGPGLNGVSDVDGAFALTLPQGDYRISAEPPFGDAVHVASVAVDEHVDGDGNASAPNVELRLQVPNVHAHVQVGSPDGPTPAANVWVDAMRDGDFGPPAAGGMTDGDGDLALALSVDGTYRLTAHPSFDDTAHVASAPVSVAVAAGVATPDSVSLTLRTPNVSGSVLDSAGQPAANAHVQAVMLGDNGQPDWEHGGAGDGQSDQTGHFALSLAPGHRYQVSAQQPFGSSELPSADVVVDLTSGPGEMTGLQLRLRLANVSGVVHTSDGHPAPHASVVVRHPGGNAMDRPVAQTQADDSGAFALVLEAGSVYQLTASPSWESPSPDAPSAPLDVDLTAASVASGLVLDFRAPNVTGSVVDPDGHPVNGASLQAAVLLDNGQPDWSGGGASAMTDSDGHFGLILEPGHRYQLNANPPFGASPSVVGGQAVSDLTEVTSLSGVQVQLRRANVMGQVVAPDGHTPVPHANINVQTAGDHQPVAFDQAGDSGDFRLSVGPGTYVVAAEPPPGSDYSRSGEITLTVAEDGSVTPSPLTLRLSQPNVIGRVVAPGPGANPVAQANVQVHSPDFRFSVGAQTDDTGAFRLSVPTGTYQLSADPPFGNTDLGRSLTVTLVVNADGAVTSPSSLDVALTNTNVAGHVLTPDGSGPVANAHVQVHSRDYGYFTDAMTGSDGGFHMNVPTGTYVMVAEGSQGSPYGRSVEATLEVDGNGQVTAPESLDLRLQSPNVSGHVFAPGTGTTPVPNAHVQLHTQNYSYSTDAMTSSDGSYHLSVPAGHYRLAADPPFGSATAGRSPEIDVVVDDSGQVTSPGSLDLHLSTPNLSGRVLGSDGTTPVNNAHVQVRSFDFSFFTGTQSGSDGSYHLSVPAGTYVLSADPSFGDTSQGRSEELTISVAADGTITPSSPIDLELTTPNLSGRVLVPQPGTDLVPNANINVRTRDFTFFTSTQAASDGSFALRVPAGRTYILTAEAPPGSGYSRSPEVTVTVDDHGDVTPSGSIDVRLSSPNVSGTVLEPEPGTSGVPNTHVQVRSVDYSFFTDAQTGTDGTFQLNVPRGDYVLTADAPFDSDFGRSVEMPLTIGADGRPTVTGPLTVRLTEANLTGTVLGPDTSTTAVGNAMVEVHNADHSFQTNAMTREDGVFRLNVPEGRYVLVATPPSTSTDQAPSLEVAITVAHDGTTTPASPLSVHLTTPNTSGVVLEPSPSSATVANVHVQVHTFDWSVSADTQTDRNGAFRLKLAPGDYVAVADAPFGDTRFGRSLETRFTVGSDGTSSPLTLRLTTPNVSGTVYYPDGTTVTNAPVNFHSDDYSFFTFAQTDDQGKFRTSLPDGTYFARAEAPRGSTFSGTPEVEVTVAGGRLTSPVTLALTLTRPSLVGRAYDPGADADSPDDDVAVGMGYVNVHNHDFTVQVGAPIGADGRFSVGGLAPGSYTLELGPSWDRSDLLRTSIDVTVPEDITQWPVTVESSPGSGRAYFDVATNTILVSLERSDDSKITTGAEVNAFNQSGGFANARTTDVDGNYVLHVAPGSWTVNVMSTSAANDWVYTDQPKRVSVPACDSSCPVTPVTLHVVAAGAHVTGSVQLPNGDPASANSTWIDVRSPDGRGSGGPLGSGGTFDVQVPAGTYQVHVFPKDSRFGEPTPVTVTVDAGHPADTGPIRMLSRDAKIQGRVAFAGASGSGAAVAGAHVFAFAAESNSFADTVTQSDGTYSINVTAGNWQVGIFPTPSDNWLYNGTPMTVQVAGGETSAAHDFTVSPSAASIRGQVLAPDGGSADVDGYVYARNLAGGGSGAPMDHGTFTIPVVAGAYEVSVFLAPGTPYTGGAPEPVTVAANGSLSSTSSALDPVSHRLNLRLESNNKHVVGQVVDGSGHAISTGSVVVSASNATGLYLETRTAGDGSYDLALGSGTWQLAYRVDGGGSVPLGLRDADGHATADNRVTLDDSTTTVVRNLAVAVAGRTISGVVHDSHGAPLALAWVHVDSVPGAPVPISQGVAGAADGTFSVSVPDGTYVISAAGGSGGDLEPLAARVTVDGAGQSPDPLVLAFRTSDASISGTVTLGGSGRAATVQAWSDGGGFASTTAAGDGSFTLSVAGNDTWHVDAHAQGAGDARNALVSQSVAVSVGAGDTRTGVHLALAPLTLPGAVTVSFDAARPQVISIGSDTSDPSDDVTITVPAGALATSGNVSLVATPIAAPSTTRNTHPVGLGYSFDAYGADGQPIKTNFNRSLAIAFTYDPTVLASLGLVPGDLVPSFWDPATRTYRRIETAVVDTHAHTVTFTTEHFTQYVVAAGATAPAAPANVVATAGADQATVTWDAVTSTGGSGLTGYTVTASPGGATASVGAGTLTATVTGLTNGTAYTFTVHATNGVGAGAESAASAAVIPAVVPGAPGNVTATAGNGQAVVAWLAPASTGGLALTGYTVTASPGGATVSVGTGTLTATVTGLTNGTAYTFTVRATNLVGSGLSAASPAVTPSAPVTTSPAGHGFRMVGADGGVFTYGGAGYYGSAGGLHLSKPIVGLAATPSDRGYWLVGSDGGVFTFGDAGFYGSTGSLHLNQPIVGMAVTPTGRGYWLVASDGGIFAFGDARYYGSTGGLHLNQPIVAMAPTPTGHGYWLVGSDGGIFAFGDARYHGSTGALHLNQPIVGLAATPTGHGYWLVASDGGVFAFGDAVYRGAVTGLGAGRSVAGITATADGLGYWIVAADGGIFPVGTADHFGSTAAAKLNAPVVSGFGR